MRRTGLGGRVFPRSLVLLLGVSLMLAFGVSCAGSAVPSPATTAPTATSPTQTAPEASATVPSTGPVQETTEWGADGVVNAGEYANQLAMGTYRLFWSTTADTIRIAVQSDAQGWVAVGFQPGTRMKNADMVFGMMVDGAALVLDCYSTGDFGPHKADVEQGGTDDLLSSAGARVGSTTTFEFERKLVTGDDLDVPLQHGVAQQIIWAYGPSDGEKVAHSTRGYAEIVP